MFTIAPPKVCNGFWALAYEKQDKQKYSKVLVSAPSKSGKCRRNQSRRENGKTTATITVFNDSFGGSSAGDDDVNVSTTTMMLVVMMPMMMLETTKSATGN